MGNRLGISDVLAVPSTQAGATSYSAASSSSTTTSSPTSLLSTNSTPQEGGDHDDHDAAVHRVRITSAETITAAAPLTTSIAPLATATTTTGMRRLRNTQADRYYNEHQKIPLPKILHDNLERMLAEQSVESKDVAENGENDNMTGITTNRDGDGASTELDNIATLTIGNSNNIHDNDHADITTTNNNNKNNKCHVRRQSKRILVIGDVHGCIDELRALVHKATHQHNSGVPFAAILVVGDLCNKGPRSAAVIRHVRTQPNWFSIRGNNEDRALNYAFAQWDENDTTIKQKYKWIAYGEDPLSDEDVEWMANLPYTITIPKTMFDDYYNEDGEEEEEDMNYLDSSSSGVVNDDDDDEDADHGTRTTTTTTTAKRQRQRLHDGDILIVHAGLDSRIPNLEKQDIHTMVNIRDVQLSLDKATPTNTDDCENTTVNEDENDGSNGNRDHSEKEMDQEQEEVETKKKERTAWAKLWHGPQLVIFGHDARRGLQTEKYAIGLDSGCCYGRELTGIILPEGEYVSVEATRVHCPFKKKKK